MPDTAIAVFADHNPAEAASAKAILGAENPTRSDVHADARSPDLLGHAGG